MMRGTFSVMAVMAMGVNALETTKLDVASLYKSAAPAPGPILGAPAHEGVCSMVVHSVKPNLDVPKLPEVSYGNRDIPSALRRRLARRYEERGEAIPDYLQEGYKHPEGIAGAHHPEPVVHAPAPQPVHVPQAVHVHQEPHQPEPVIAHQIHAAHQHHAAHQPEPIIAHQHHAAHQPEPVIAHQHQAVHAPELVI